MMPNQATVPCYRPNHYTIIHINFELQQVLTFDEMPRTPAQGVQYDKPHTNMQCANDFEGLRFYQKVEIL